MPERWRGLERFVIVETGFGLGLNFLATWQCWRDDPQACGHLHFVSFERHPLSGADLAVVQRRWPELAEPAGQLQRQWPAPNAGAHRLQFEGERVLLTLHFGDAAELLQQHAAGIHGDAFFLDGFAPAKNPALWSPHILKALAKSAAPGATLATWTVAAAVRQGLSAAGFAVTKAPGFGTKREMLRGVRRQSAQDGKETCNNPLDR